MTTADTLDRGRESFGRRAWADAFDKLYFVGLVFLYALASSLVGGVGRDAEHIAEQIASREPNGRPTEHVAGARPPEAP